MNQLGEDFSNIVQTVSAILAIIAAVGGAILGAIRAIKRRKFKIAPYYVSRGVFADREQSLCDLTSMLRSDIRVINVYGKRGIGKSTFLRFFCDFTNHKLNRENRREKAKKKGIRAARGRALYLHISGDGARSIDEQIISQIGGRNSTLDETAEWIAQMIRHKRIFLVIDNINNAGLSKEIEAVIDTFLSHSNRYRIIIGSIEKQPFLNIINEKQIKYIELPVFDADDIFDFAAKNAKSVAPEYLAKIIDFSEGLPVFVSLLLSNSISPLSTITYDRNRMDNYLGRIIDDLDTSLSIIAQYISFLSITKPILSIRLLKEFEISLPVGCFEKLENCSLIELDKDAQTIKMHELFRDYICRRFFNSTNIIKEICEYYRKEDLLYEQIYYLIMIGNEAHDKTIHQAIQNAIDEENFAFLLMLGEHYKCLYGWSSTTTNMSEETFLIIIYGYVEGLIGVGNYPAAREVIDKCKISARSPKTDVQFRFSMLTAQLYHLQNNYEESIAAYEILLFSAQNDESFRKYEAKCLWGIAHSLRHQGKDLDAAIQFYNKSISAAKKLNKKSEVIKSMREKLIIFLLRRQTEDACNLHYQICTLVNCLPKSGYTETRTSFLKTEASYIGVMKKKNPQLEYKLLSRVLDTYKSQRKRLQYNVCFQIGEYYRHQGNLDLARENYHKSLAFSEKNLDRNLETLSQIALAICEICCPNSQMSGIEEQLVHCIDVCEQFDLNTNKSLAEVILAYAQDVNVDGTTIAKLEHIQYAAAINASRQMSHENLQQLDLFLM